MTVTLRFGTPCVRCSRPMVPRRWRPPEGMVSHQGRGLCLTCYTITTRVAIRGTYPGGVPRPDEDVDVTAVFRACDGDRRVRLNTLERRRAVAVLTDRRLSAAAIAKRLGLAERSVTRIRARLRQHTQLTGVAS